MKYNVFKEIIQKYETPVYLFDADEFKSRIRKINRLLGERIQLCYAMKANPFLIKNAIKELECLEVCSPGEFAICERASIPMECIVLSGVYKAKEDIKSVLEKYRGAGVYTIESVRQLELFDEEAEKKQLELNVLLRFTSGNQFGMDEETIRDIIKRREGYRNIHILGIQFYSGTQKKKTSLLEKEIVLLDELLCNLEKDYKFHAEILEYGPGLYVSYFQKEGRLNEIEEISELRKNLEAMKFHGKIILEMGRYLAASCGYYLTKIVDKKINNYQEYAIVDGGTHQMNYFGQTMAMKLPYFVQLNGKTLLERNFDEESHREVTVCGALCTVSDVLVKNMPLYGEYLGDIIVFENVGAYSVTEGISLFLSRSLPKIVMWSEKEGLKLKRDIVESSLFNSGDSKIKSYS